MRKLSMKSIENVKSAVVRAEQALEALLFTAAACVVAGGTIAVCIPGVLGFT
jgi:tRNA1(Val) A37 N6-methylase TrmN6